MMVSQKVERTEEGSGDGKARNLNWTFDGVMLYNLDHSTSKQASVVVGKSMSSARYQAKGNDLVRRIVSSESENTASS
jgi:hypothetical protein